MTKLTMCFAGQVASGLGEGAYFSSLEWLHRQLQAGFGFIPVPGTFNVRIGEADIARFAELQQHPGFAIVPPDAAFCAAKCFRAYIGTLEGVLVVPLMPNCRRDVLEILAPVYLRETLTVNDGDCVEVCIEIPAETGSTGEEPNR